MEVVVYRIPADHAAILADGGFPPTACRLDQNARISLRDENLDCFQNGGLPAVVGADQEIYPAEISKLILLKSSVIVECERVKHCGSPSPSERLSRPAAVSSRPKCHGSRQVACGGNGPAGSVAVVPARHGTWLNVRTTVDFATIRATARRHLPWRNPCESRPSDVDLPRDVHCNIAGQVRVVQDTMLLT